MKVKGIKDGEFSKIRDLITVKRVALPCLGIINPVQAVDVLRRGRFSIAGLMAAVFDPCRRIRRSAGGFAALGERPVHDLAVTLLLSAVLGAAACQGPVPHALAGLWCLRVDLPPGDVLALASAQRRYGSAAIDKGVAGLLPALLCWGTVVRQRPPGRNEHEASTDGWGGRRRLHGHCTSPLPPACKWSIGCIIGGSATRSRRLSSASSVLCSVRCCPPAESQPTDNARYPLCSTSGILVS